MLNTLRTSPRLLRTLPPLSKDLECPFLTEAGIIHPLSTCWRHAQKVNPGLIDFFREEGWQVLEFLGVTHFTPGNRTCSKKPGLLYFLQCEVIDTLHELDGAKKPDPVSECQ